MESIRPCRPDELEREVAAGVSFWGYEAEGRLLGVMGIQDRGDVDLIRHAYVTPQSQRGGIGGRLIEHLRALAAPLQKERLLRKYWSISDRQVETSVVLANPPELARLLIA